MARGEIFVQLAVDFPNDTKVRALARHGKAARLARDLYVQMILYCRDLMTDGFVPDEQIGVLCYPDPPATGSKQAKMLADVELIERRDGGWYVPAYLKRNKSRAQIAADAEAKEAAAIRGNHERWHVKRDVVDPQCPMCSQEGSHTRSRGGSPPDRGDDIGGSSTESPETETETETETEKDTTSPTSAAARRATRPRGQRGTARPEPPADAGPPGPAEQIVSDWIAGLRHPPLERVASAIGLTVQAALGQGLDPADVAEAVRRWQAKGNLGPAALASFVHEVANAPRNSNGLARREGRPSTTDERVNAGLALAEQLDAMEANP